MALRMTPSPWFRSYQSAGFVPGNAAESLDFAFVPDILAIGTYTASLLINTGDPLHPIFNLPVSLTIGDGQLSGLQQWRLSYFGTPDNTGNASNDADIDGDGLKNIFEYAFNTSPTNSNSSPLAFGIVNDHLVLTFPRKHPAPTDISYLYEVSSDLTSAVWNSGPSYFTETVTDNLNGTETVSVTLNSSVSGSQRRFVRLRISQP
jgi:hypothetical protein